MLPRALPQAPAWAEQLFTIGVTGTNGKTSTTSAAAALLGVLGKPVASVTTLGSYLDETPLEVAPHYAGFLQTMRSGVEAGGRYAAIELTSEALAVGFARAWPCRIGVFTNLSHEHAKTHGTAEHYLASKAQLFMALPRGGTAVLNARDALPSGGAIRIRVTSVHLDEDYAREHPGVAPPRRLPVGSSQADRPRGDADGAHRDLSPTRDSDRCRTRPRVRPGRRWSGRRS